MKKLLNTLYVTSGNRYLSLDGENVVVLEDKKEVGRIPLPVSYTHLTLPTKLEV